MCGSSHLTLLLSANGLPWLFDDLSDSTLSERNYTFISGLMSGDLKVNLYDISFGQMGGDLRVNLRFSIE